jgi:purine-nucleoside phosphorylase
VKAAALLTISDVPADGGMERIGDEALRRAVDGMAEVALEAATAELTRFADPG